jgi:hypothetical protein
MRDESNLRSNLGGGSSSSGGGSGGGSVAWEPVLPVAFQTAWVDKELVDDLVRKSIRKIFIPEFAC